MNHLAIYACYPQVVIIDDKAGAFDAQGNKVEIDFNLVNSWVNPNEYKALRSAEYPPITDYLDAIVKNDQAQIDKYISDCKKVKNKYPKSINT